MRKRCRRHEWGPWHWAALLDLWKGGEKSGYQRICLKCPSYQQTGEVVSAAPVRAGR